MSEIEKKSIDMKEHEYYVVLNNNLVIDNNQKQKLHNIDPLIKQTKKPFSDHFIDIYEISSNKHDCEDFIAGQDASIQNLFEINQFRNGIKYTAFLDILGFSVYIKEHITNDFQADDFHNDLREIIDYLEFMKNETFDIVDAQFLDDMELKYSWISDTFVVTIEYTKDADGKDVIIKSLMLMQLSIIVSSIYHFIANKYKLLIRGGVSSKYSCITPNLILGEGIIESANLEKNIAIYPRVIFEHSIITEEIYKKLSLQYNNNYLNCIAKDCDGYYFVNFLAMLQYIPPMIGKIAKVPNDKIKEQTIGHKLDILNSYKRIIVNGLAADEYKIKSKYIWLDNYMKEMMKHEEY
jgi:hypothetical protein